jgi:hypothetical protein
VGGEKWKKSIGSNRLEIGMAVSQTADRAFLIAGQREPTGRNLADAYLVRTDTGGSVLWTSTYDAAGHGRAIGTLQCGDGGFVMAGDAKGGPIFIRKLAPESK